jgi:lipoyl(octanoyl) transferase
MNARGESLLRVLDLGHRAYGPVLQLQEQMVEERQADRIPDSLLLVEHDPVYTLGRNAKEGNVVASPDDLRKMGIEVVKIGRGGDVTYHGPGQLVGYPILHLKKRGISIVDYVGSLEQVILRVLRDYGIEGGTDRKNRGVWVGNDKVAAIGVRVTRYVTMHGFSLNVTADLSYYRGIIPCGIRDKGVTSLHQLASGVKMDDVKEKVVKEFVEVFGYGEAVKQ